MTYIYTHMHTCLIFLWFYKFNQSFGALVLYFIAINKEILQLIETCIVFLLDPDSYKP